MFVDIEAISSPEEEMAVEPVTTEVTSFISRDHVLLLEPSPNSISRLSFYSLSFSLLFSRSFIKISVQVISDF